MNQVHYFKLSNGDEIIASVKETREDGYIVQNPFVLRYTNMAGHTTVMMFPWVISPTVMKCDFTFHRTSILAESIAPESFQTAHSAAVQSLSSMPEAQPMDTRMVSDDSSSDDDEEGFEEDEDEGIENSPELMDELERIFKKRLN